MKLLIYGSLLAVAAAGTILAAAKIDFDHNATFERYHTFAWRQDHPASNGVGDNTLLRSRITNVVDQQLTEKGMQENTGNPDVYLSYHFNATSRKDISYIPGWGWRRRGWGAPDFFVTRYTEGAFVIDMVDAKTNQLIWRAYGTDTGSNPMDVQSEKNVGKIVSHALKHFPPQDNHAS